MNNRAKNDPVASSNIVDILGMVIVCSLMLLGVYFRGCGH